MTTLTEKAMALSRFRKERFLISLSEDSFRDEVVRPLLLLRGFEDGRDYCGPEECGKDANRLPAKGDIKRMKGRKIQNIFRLRVGSYRVIFVMEEELIKVLDIAPRGEAYK